VGRFVDGDLVGVRERQPDVVQAVEQTMAAEIVDFKGQLQAVLVAERAAFEIDRELVAGVCRGPAKQVVDLGLVEPDRQQTERG
jgi:hypothetical protein